MKRLSCQGLAAALLAAALFVSGTGSAHADPTKPVPPAKPKIKDEVILESPKVGKVVLRSTLDEQNWQTSYTLLQNNVVKARVGWKQHGYPVGNAQAEDLDGDGQPEVLLYRNSTGSAAAVALNVYKIAKPEWKELFSLEPVFSAESRGRFHVQYIGNYQASFSDKVSGIRATIPLVPSHYKDLPKDQTIEQWLKRIETWVDPVSGYKIADIDGDKTKEIIALQRIIGISHPDTIANFRTTYKLVQGQYRIVSYTLLDADDKRILAEAEAKTKAR